MAGAPPLQVRIESHGAWTVGVGLLVALSCALVLAWWAIQPVPAPGWAGAVALAACLGSVALGVASMRRTECVLHWDGRQWSLALGAADAESGDLGAAIDLGAWMLLRFVPGGRRGWRAARWIPVQRRGLEASWHALRCTVYASRSREAAPN
jgi:hypothetical protein